MTNINSHIGFLIVWLRFACEVWFRFDDCDWPLYCHKFHDNSVEFVWKTSTDLIFNMSDFAKHKADFVWSFLQ